jgi:hypothetical protein
LFGQQYDVLVKAEVGEQFFCELVVPQAVVCVVVFRELHVELFSVGFDRDRSRKAELGLAIAGMANGQQGVTEFETECTWTPVAADGTASLVVEQVGRSVEGPCFETRVQLTWTY